MVPEDAAGAEDVGSMVSGERERADHCQLMTSQYCLRWGGSLETSVHEITDYKRKGSASTTEAMTYGDWALFTLQRLHKHW